MKGFLLLITLLVSANAFAQLDSTSQAKGRIAAPDSVTADTLIVPTKQGEIASPIIYSCNDSISMDVINKRVFLYGNAKVIYGDMTLTAGRIEIDYGNNNIKASSSGDSLKKDTPVFKQQGDFYEARHIEYNIKSKKGIVRDIVTQQGEGYIQGDPVKRTEDAVYVKHAKYTTCNLAHPHYYVNARKLKVIPEDKVVTGPFNMVLSDIPTPIGLPFGFFPITTRSKSGIIFPTLGEQRDRGFYVSQGGFYWAASDRLGVKIIGDYYTNNSYRMTLASEYKTRYRYDGNMTFNYSRVKSGFNNEPFPTDFNVLWSHSTLKKTSGKFSASVNITSNNYYKLNSYNPTSYQSSVFTSTISYYKTFKNSPFNLGVTLRQDQNVITKQMNLTAPEVNFSMNRIYPFKKAVSTGNNWYEKINVSYNLNTKYAVTNTLKLQNAEGQTVDSTIAFKGDNVKTVLENGKIGMKHSIPISTTFKVLKYFSLNPTFTYEDFWYIEKLHYQYSNTTKSVIVKDTIPGFTRAGAYNLSTNLTTRLYGMYKINGKVLKGIRHTAVPTLNYTFKPDFSSPAIGNSYQEVAKPDGTSSRYSVYNGYIYGAPSQGLVNSVGFSLQNTFEAKIRNKKDTTGTKATKKVTLIDNIGIAGSYNFSADSLKLSLLSLTARTKLYIFDIAFNSQIDPYDYKVDSIVKEQVYQRRIQKYNLRLYSYSLSIGANLNPKARDKQAIPDLSKVNPEELSLINSHPERYIDFKIPWSLNLAYNINYAKTGYLAAKTTQSLTASGNLSLTEKWKLTASSGYDFIAKGLSYTTIGIVRDLHCWQMSINVVPFGLRQSYFFTFTAKSSLLQDLKLTKRSPTYSGQSF